MSKRLDTERQELLEPKRIDHYKKKIVEFGYSITVEDKTHLEFIFKGSTIHVFPYSGWCSGKTITDCRGLSNLLKQIKQ